MSHRFLLSLFSLIILSSTSAVAQSFVHPGMLHTKAQLAFMKQKVQGNQTPWQAAWEVLQNGRGSSLEFSPQPFTHVVRGPYGKPSIGDRQLSSSARAAYSHALQWTITHNKAHAQKAIEILNTWSNRLWTFQDNDAKLLAAWTGDDFCNAAEILRYSDSGWQKKDIAQFERMLRTVYYPLLERFFPRANGNWDGAIINTMLCIGIFCDDRAIFDRAINHYMRGNGNGGITKYIYPSGQCQETTRDQSHTQLGLREFALASRVAWNQGIDLYAVADNRLALGFEYTAQYLLGEDVPAYGVPSPQRRKRLSDIYESIYQHYHHVKGLEMPYVARAVEKARARTRRPAQTALTMYEGPLPTPPKSMGPPMPSLQAPKAGAGNGPTATPPASAIHVAQSENIQAALDSCAIGGWVVLGKGVHKLPTTLKIPSGITLSGQGLETVLFLDPEAADRAGVAIVNATDDLHNVIFRDFVVEGSTRPDTPDDPNSIRRVEAGPKTKRRAGIVLAAQQTGQMKNLRFEHVTVHHCTRDGLAIFGAENVTIIACDFTFNGGSVVPGPGIQHNLQLSRIIGATVTNSRLDTSPHGCGLDLNHSSDVTVSNCETARNALHGIRITESKKITLNNNLVEGNDGNGIALTFQMDGSQNIQILENLVQNNGGTSIEIAEGVDAELKNNKHHDNGH
jgi:parallel beta-helix repeat protein